MKTSADIIRIFRDYFNDRAKGYGIRSMALFGSVARNEQTDGSDIDIMYEGEPNLFQRCQIKEELEAIFGIPVDLVRMRKSLQGSLFLKQIKKDLIYV